MMIPRLSPQPCGILTYTRSMMDEREPTSGLRTGPSSAIHYYDCVSQGIRKKKKRGVKSLFCPRKFQKLRVTVLKIDARDVA